MIFASWIGLVDFLSGLATKSLITLLVRSACYDCVDARESTLYRTQGGTPDGYVGALLNCVGNIEFLPHLSGDSGLKTIDLYSRALVLIMLP